MARVGCARLTTGRGASRGASRRASRGARRLCRPAEVNRPSPLSVAVTLALAVGVFGVSFGVLAVGVAAFGVPGLRHVAAGVHRRVAVRGDRRDRRRWVAGGRAGQRAAAGGPQRRLRPGDGARAPGPAWPAAGRRPARHRRVDRRWRWPRTDRPASARRSGSPVWRCSCAGTSARWSGSLGGQAIGDPETFGLDAAFPAGFVALLAPHLRSLDGRARGAARCRRSPSCWCPSRPMGLPILAAALAALVGLRPGARP